MPKFAVIKDNTVKNIIVADSLEIAQSVTQGFECIEYVDEGDNSPHIGLGYLNGIFEQPPIPEEVLIELNTINSEN